MYTWRTQVLFIFCVITDDECNHEWVNSNDKGPVGFTFLLLCRVTADIVCLQLTRQARGPDLRTELQRCRPISSNFFKPDPKLLLPVRWLRICRAVCRICTFRSS
jgi:hypothetical protein